VIKGLSAGKFGTYFEKVDPTPLSPEAARRVTPLDPALINSA
jgi:hypothetical protein